MVVVGGRGTGPLAAGGIAGVTGVAEADGLADTGRMLACGGRGTLCTGAAGCTSAVPIAGFGSVVFGVAGDAGLAGCAAFGIVPRTGCIGWVPAAG